jgi:DNA-binding SARP family transcriptional activator
VAYPRPRGVSSARTITSQPGRRGGGAAAADPDAPTPAAPKTAPAVEGVWLAPAPRPPRRTARQRAADLARGITSLVGLLLLIVGLPAGLAYGVGWPLPRSWDAVYTWLNGPTRVTPRGLVAAGACVLWLLWLAITIAVVIEIVAAARRVRVPRLALTTPFQGLAAGLVGTAVIALTGTTARAASPPQPASSTLATNPPQLSSAPDSPAPGAAQTGRGQVTLVAAGRRYTATVHHGDTLSAIARDWLGDPDRWPEIYRLNEGRHFPHVGGSLTDPNLIYPGWVLDLPDDASPPSGSTATEPAPPPTADTEHRPPSPSAEAPIPPGTAAPPTPTAPSPTPPSSDTATPRAPTAEPRPPEHSPDRGVDLPDHGWVAAPVAAAVTAAAALVWIQRRRRYRPHPPAGTRSRESDLAPLPNTVAVLHRARAAPQVDDHGKDHLDEIPDDVPAEAMEAMTVTHTAIGVHAGQPLRLTDLPSRGTGLVGPGADDAGRGVIAAVLSSGGPWAGSAEASLTTTAADLRRLLGANHAGRYSLDRLQAAPDLNSMLDQLERELLYRTRIASEQRDLDDDELTGETADALPPLVLLTQAPTEPTATRLEAILTIGTRLSLTGILLGAWPAGATWHVATDGTTQADGQSTGTRGPRLNVLDHTAVHDILGTLQQARPIDVAPAEPAIATPAESHAPTPADHPGEAAPTQRTPASLVPTPPAARYRLRLAILGRPSAQLIGGDRTEELRIRRTDGVQILVHLAVDPDGATSDQLMATLWPEIRPRYARGRFHTTISELRHSIAAALGTNIILNTGGRYHLDPQQVEVDLWHVYTAIERAASAVDPDAHSGALRDIIQLHIAPIAAGEDWLWVLPYREATRRHVLDAYTELANEEADPRAALDLIQQAIDLDPYNEDLYQRAMRLHAALNHPDGVHRALRAITERLAQLDDNVSAQTRRLAADLLTKLDARRRS